MKIIFIESEIKGLKNKEIYSLYSNGVKES